MTEDELKHRTKHFALRVMKLVDALPNTPAGRTIRSQLANHRRLPPDPGKPAQDAQG